MDGIDPDQLEEGQAERVGIAFRRSCHGRSDGDGM